MLAKPLHKPLAHLRRTLDEPVGVERIEQREGGSAGEGGAVIRGGVNDVARRALPACHRCWRADGRREREATAEPLAEADDVRCHTLSDRQEHGA